MYKTHLKSGCHRVQHGNAPTHFPLKTATVGSDRWIDGESTVGKTTGILYGVTSDRYVCTPIQIANTTL